MTKQNHQMAFIAADYEEFMPETFRGYVVEYRDMKKTFPTLDEASEYAYTLGVPFAHLSSVDDYEMDKAEASRSRRVM